MPPPEPPPDERSRRLPMRIGSFSDEVLRSGAQSGDKLLWAQAEPPSAAAAEALGLAGGDLVHAVQRLRTVDGEAVAIETTYFPALLTPGLLDEPLTGSLWLAVREKYGLIAQRADATLEVITLDEDTAELLSATTAAPGILVTRRAYDPDGRCFEYARDVYRADRVEFLIEDDIPSGTSRASRLEP